MTTPFSDHPPSKFAVRLMPSLALGTLCAILFLSQLSPVMAQGKASSEVALENEVSGDTIYSLLVKGGWLMIPIGLCSITILMFAIERAISLRKPRTTPNDLLENVFELLPVGDVSKSNQSRSVERLRESNSLLGSVLLAGVAKMHHGRTSVETFLSEAGNKQFLLLKRKLRPFAIVENLAPLLGLLGTVYGMITCFENAASTDAASRSETLAKGIYAALVTTASGISVAIPAKLLFHFFEAKVDRIVDEIEEASNELIENYFGDSPLPEPHSTLQDTLPASDDVESSKKSSSHKTRATEPDEKSDASISSKQVHERKKRLIAKAMKRPGKS